MSVGVFNQYKVFFNLASLQDFIDEEAIDHFTVIEVAGGDLPQFELVFSYDKTDILPYLNEGNQLVVSYEDEDGKTFDINLSITESELDNQGSEGKVYTIRGLFAATGYYLDHHVYITKKQPSMFTMSEIAGKHFSFDTNRPPPNDKQYWIQHGITDQRFLNNVWLHTDFTDSFPLVGITAKGQYRYYDAKKMPEPSIEFGYDENADYELEQQYKVRTGTGLLNIWGAYNIQQHQTSLYDAGSFSSTVTTNPVKNIFTGASTLHRASSAPANFELPVHWMPDNVHPNYWECYRRNLTSLLSYSTHQAVVRCTKKYVDVNILDTIIFKDNMPYKKSAVEDYSGTYIVTMVSRVLAKRGMTTTLTFSREAVNTQEGALR